MTLDPNSYGSVEEVEVYGRHLLDGESEFNSTTTPTLAELETVMDRVSSVLNLALSGKGFDIPLEDATAVAACAHWVVDQTIYDMRLAYPHLGVTTDEKLADRDIFKAARAFVDQNEQAFKTLDETVDTPASEGLTFTGLGLRANRSDVSNTSYEQAKFYRGQFDA